MGVYVHVILLGVYVHLHAMLIGVYVFMYYYWVCIRTCNTNGCVCTCNTNQYGTPTCQETGVSANANDVSHLSWFNYNEL